MAPDERDEARPHHEGIGKERQPHRRHVDEHHPRSARPAGNPPASDEQADNPAPSSDQWLTPSSVKPHGGPFRNRHEAVRVVPRRTSRPSASTLLNTTASLASQPAIRRGVTFSGSNRRPPSLVQIASPERHCRPERRCRHPEQRHRRFPVSIRLAPPSHRLLAAASKRRSPENHCRDIKRQRDQRDQKPARAACRPPAQPRSSPKKKKASDPTSAATEHEKPALLPAAPAA